MRDIDQITAMREVMLPLLPAGTRMLQGYPPSTMAQPSAPTISLYALPGVDYGFVSRRDVWNGATFDHIETQVVETTWQVNAIVPNADDAMDADTLLRQFRMHLRSDSAMAALRAKGLNLYRPRDIRRTPIAESDGGDPEWTVSFDVTVQHSDILTATTPVVVSTETIIERV
ncbi:MAG: hypothetical protein RSG92_15135 [Pseudomonas sp.]